MSCSLRSPARVSLYQAGATLQQETAEDRAYRPAGPRTSCFKPNVDCRPSTMTTTEAACAEWVTDDDGPRTGTDGRGESREQWLNECGDCKSVWLECALCKCMYAWVWSGLTKTRSRSAG